jgi:hypothetical protein
MKLPKKAKLKINHYYHSIGLNCCVQFIKWDKRGYNCIVCKVPKEVWRKYKRKSYRNRTSQTMRLDQFFIGDEIPKLKAELLI